MKSVLVILIFSFLINTSIFSQSENDSTSHHEDIEQKIPLNFRNLNNYPDVLIFNSSSDFSLPVYFSNERNEFRRGLNLDMKKINSQLLNDFRLKMQWQKRDDLGVIGQYLGYAMSAAAAGLAISHIVKYKDKAWIGR